MSEEDIRKIKNHIFFDKHVLHDGYKQFDVDYDIAVAWERLTEGRPESRDITLLKHELAEAKAEAAGAATLADAHSIANQSYNWQEQLVREKGEQGEDDDILQAGKP